MPIQAPNEKPAIQHERASGLMVWAQSSAEAAYLVDNPVRRCPDIRKARAEIGYAPSVSIDEGLRRALTWYAQAPQGSER